MMRLGTVPNGFTPNDKIGRLLDARKRLAEGPASETFDWGVGEHLAFATILDEGRWIRRTSRPC